MGLMCLANTIVHDVAVRKDMISRQYCLDSYMMYYSYLLSLFYHNTRHMMGKRVNYACRSVISPDPYIGTNEIGLPLHFAKTLTFPTPVTALNIADMQNLVRRGPAEYPGAVWVEFPNGQRVDLSKMKERSRHAIAARLLTDNGVVKVGRQLRDGDMVLMNRQVSENSMM